MNIINEILDFSKIESGKLELEMRTFEWHACIEDVLDLLASKAGEKKLDLVFLPEPDLPEAIIGDANRLRQILLNLVGNSVKFTTKGEIVIYAGKWKSETPIPNIPHNSPLVSPDAWLLHFKVRDTGIGIPADRISRLFKSFSQADASTSREFGGTGLGLSISKRLAELMGGAMWVESIQGQGSTFHFVIQTQTRCFRPKCFCAQQQNWRGLRVLMVHGNHNIRRFFGTEIRNWKMRFDDFESTAGAIRLLQGGAAFDIAILDYQIPVSDLQLLSLELKKRSHPKKNG